MDMFETISLWDNKLVSLGLGTCFGQLNKGTVLSEEGRKIKQLDVMHKLAGIYTVFFFKILFQVISYLVLIYNLILTNYKVLYPLKIFFLILQLKHGIEYKNSSDISKVRVGGSLRENFTQNRHIINPPILFVQWGFSRPSD